MKLLSITDKTGVEILISAMLENPRYRSVNKVELQDGDYQIAAIPVLGGAILGSFYQTMWDRVDIDDISGDYYVMPLLSGWRIQVHIYEDRIDMFSSNGKKLDKDKLSDMAQALWRTDLMNSIIETVWREEDGICYITDIVMLSGLDMSQSSYADRYTAMSNIEISHPIKLIPIKVIKSREDLDDFMSDKTSVVIRDGNSPTLVSIYTKPDKSQIDEAKDNVISSIRELLKLDTTIKYKDDLLSIIDAIEGD